MSPELRFAPNNQLSNTYFAVTHNFAARQLYVPYFTSLIIFSRFQRPPGSLTLTAILAASFVARIFEDFLARDELKVLAPIFTRHCLISSMALVSVMPYQRLWEAAQPDFKILQDALAELSKRWRSAIGASKALENAISKRQQRGCSTAALIHLDDENLVELFGMIDLGYCRMWDILNQQLNGMDIGGHEELEMPFQAPHAAVETGMFLDPGEELDVGIMQFQHVEDWILNDSYLLQP